MPSPFPGMDPYLEDPRHWPDLHARMITGLAAALGPLVRPRYFVQIEARLVLLQPDEESAQTFTSDVLTRRVAQVAEGQTDVTAVATGSPGAVTVLLPELEQRTERWLEIRRTESEQVAGVIEVLSPWNKRTGAGAADYHRKRQAVLDSEVHLVEIDLLRQGQRPALQANPPRPPAEYYVLVSRAPDRPRCKLWPIELLEPLPEVPIPLLPPDPDVTINLQHIFERAYDEAGYDLILHYRSEPVPPLSRELAESVDALLRKSQHRTGD